MLRWHSSRTRCAPGVVDRRGRACRTRRRLKCWASPGDHRVAGQPGQVAAPARLEPEPGSRGAIATSIPTVANPTSTTVSDLLSGLDPRRTAPQFWRASTRGSISLTALRDAETPEHLERFWPSFRRRAARRTRAAIGDHRNRHAADTVFDNAAPATTRTRRRRPRPVEVAGGSKRSCSCPPRPRPVASSPARLAWWSTRDPSDTLAADRRSRGRPRPRPAARLRAHRRHRCSAAKAVSNRDRPRFWLALGTVGASPDGRFLYMAAPAQSNERCTFSPSDPTSTRRWGLYAQPVDGSSPDGASSPIASSPSRRWWPDRTRRWSFRFVHARRPT